MKALMVLLISVTHLVNAETFIVDYKGIKYDGKSIIPVKMENGELGVFGIISCFGSIFNNRQMQIFIQQGLNSNTKQRLIMGYLSSDAECDQLTRTLLGAKKGDQIEFSNDQLTIYNKIYKFDRW